MSSNIPTPSSVSAVPLRYAFQLVLLLDRVRVRRLLRAVNDLIREAFRDGLDVAERGGPGTRRDQIDRLVHAAERRHIDSLAAHNAGRADARRILAGPAVLHRIHKDLNRVLVSQEKDDLEGVLD